MHAIVFIAVFLCGHGQAEYFAGPAGPCDEIEAAAICTHPALEFLIQQSTDSEHEAPSEASWTAQLTAQCEVDKKGRDCVNESASGCLSSARDPTSATTKATVESDTIPCDQKAAIIVQGCSSNSSAWYKACTDSFVDGLHSFLTHPPSSTEFRRFHTRICYELGHNIDCGMNHAIATCDIEARTVLQGILQYATEAYQCANAANSFPGY